MTAAMQICRTCNEIKDLEDDFWKQASSKSGYQTECKDCMRVRSAKWHQSSDATSTERVNEWRIANPLLHTLRSAKSRAKKRGLPFDLTVDDLRPFPTHCPVLGIPFVWTVGTGTGVQPGTPSLERLVLERGYVRGNVVLISYRANVLRKDATLEELKMMVAFYEAVSSGDPSRVRDSGPEHGDGAVLRALSEVLAHPKTNEPEEAVLGRHD